MADWAALPDDLIVHILARLELRDFVAAAASCSSWRAAASTALPGRLSPHRKPWFVALTGDESRIAYLYDLSPRDPVAAVPITLPFPAGIPCVGASRGWLLFAGVSGELTLYNPFSRRRIPLPPVFALHNSSYHLSVGHRFPLSDGQDSRFFFDVDGNRHQMCFGASRGKLLELLSGFELSADPCAGDDFWVALKHRPLGSLSVLRFSDRRWQMLHLGCEIRHEDCIFYDGRLLSVTDDGRVMNWDLSAVAGGSAANSTIVASDDGTQRVHRRRLVPAPWGDLLLLRVYEQEAKYHTGVSRVNMDASEVREMNPGELRGHALLFGYCSSGCVPAGGGSDGGSGVAAGCVYYTCQWSEPQMMWLRLGSHTCQFTTPAKLGIGGDGADRRRFLGQPVASESGPPLFLLPPRSG